MKSGHFSRTSYFTTSLAMFVAVGLLGLAWLLSPDFVEHHLVPDGQINDTTRAQVTLFRLGLCGLAGVVTVLWWGRKTLARSIHIARTHHAALPVAEIPSARVLMGRPGPRWLRIGLAVALPAWLVAVEVSFFGQIQWPRFFLTEYGVLENATAVLYLAAGMLALVLAISRRGIRRPIGFHRGWMGLLGLFCILIALEEVNWGQVYFDFNTPGLLRQVNYQGEASLHNLRLPGPVPVRKMYWANEACWWLALCGAVVPWLVCASPRGRRFVWIGEIPIPPLLAQGYFLAAVLIPGDEWMFEYRMQPTEMREISMAVAFALWVWTERNRRHIYARLGPPLQTGAPSA